MEEPGGSGEIRYKKNEKFQQSPDRGEGAADRPPGIYEIFSTASFIESSYLAVILAHRPALLVPHQLP
jgi:hypothetical protein